MTTFLQWWFLAGLLGNLIVVALSYHYGEYKVLTVGKLIHHLALATILNFLGFIYLIVVICFTIDYIFDLEKLMSYKLWDKREDENGQ